MLMQGNGSHLLDDTYAIIRLDKANGQINAEFYRTADNSAMKNFHGTDANSILSEIAAYRKLNISPLHAEYIRREVGHAESCRENELTYVQDTATPNYLEEAAQRIDGSRFCG